MSEEQLLSPQDGLQEHPHLEMGEQFHVVHANKYVAAYIFVLLLLGAAGGVYVWQHKKLENLRAQTQTLQTRADDLTKKLATFTVMPSQKAAAVTPDATWKTYCDSLHSECFKYPATWILTDSTAAQFGHTIIELTNPAKTVSVNYDNEFVKDGFSATFHTSLLANSTVSGLKVVGGYFPGSTRYTTSLAVVNDVVAQALNLKVGALGQLVDTIRFTDKDKHTVQFVASGSQTTTSDAAEAWFNSADAQTASVVLQSLYYQ